MVFSNSLTGVSFVLTIISKMPLFTFCRSWLLCLALFLPFRLDQNRRFDAHFVFLSEFRNEHYSVLDHLVVAVPREINKLADALAHLQFHVLWHGFQQKRLLLHHGSVTKQFFRRGHKNTTKNAGTTRVCGSPLVRVIKRNQRRARVGHNIHRPVNSRLGGVELSFLVTPNHKRLRDRPKRKPATHFLYPAAGRSPKLALPKNIRSLVRADQQ